MVCTVAYKNLRTVQGIKPNSTSEITSPFHLSYGDEITQVIAIMIVCRKLQPALTVGRSRCEEVLLTDAG